MPGLWRDLDWGYLLILLALDQVVKWGGGQASLVLSEVPSQHPKGIRRLEWSGAGQHQAPTLSSLYSEEGAGWRWGRAELGPLHWNPKEVGIPLSPSRTGGRLDMGTIRSFEPFPPSFRSPLNFLIRDKEIDNPSLSLNQQSSVPLTLNRKAGAKRPRV